MYLSSLVPARNIYLSGQTAHLREGQRNFGNSSDYRVSGSATDLSPPKRPDPFSPSVTGDKEEGEREGKKEKDGKKEEN